MSDSETPFEAIPYSLVKPDRIPVERYYDEDFYRLENERVWPHVWQMACRLEQIAKLGDWVEYSNLGKSVIVVRTKSGVKAYHNACRHRGVQLVSGHGNCKDKGFICPFHGWRWNADGKNTFVYGRHMFDEEQLDEGDLALRPCRVETWGGCAFINFDDDAPSLRETLGSRGEQIEKYDIDDLRAEWWCATMLPANWKVAMEAFMEGYHVLRTHPQLHVACGSLFNSMYGADTGGIVDAINPKMTARENVHAHFRLMESSNSGMGGKRIAKDIETARALLDVELPEDPAEALGAWFDLVAKQITADGRARGERTPDLATLARDYPLRGVEYLFPHFFLLQSFSTTVFSAYRVRPLGPESCLFELWSLARFPVEEEPAPIMEPQILHYASPEFPAIPQQDYENIPLQQIGLHADGFEFMRLSRDKEGMISHYQQLIDGYLKRADPRRLAEATGDLVGHFDGPIAALDL